MVVVVGGGGVVVGGAPSVTFCIFLVGERSKVGVRVASPWHSLRTVRDATNTTKEGRICLYFVVVLLWLQTFHFVECGQSSMRRGQSTSISGLHE